MGAAIGVYFAIDNPGMVQKLVVADTITSSPSNAGIPDLFGPRVELAQTDCDGIQKLTESALERRFSANFRESQPAEIDRMRQLMWTTSKEAYITCCHALRHDSFDMQPLPGKVGSSVENVHLVVGELNVNLPETMETMRQEI